jgi:hypothetical protein
VKLAEIYELFIKRGVENDPRGKEELGRYLEKAQESFKKIDKKDKELFDEERLTNPYADTRILYGDANKEIKRILAGIDIEVGELLLADRLSERGQVIDLVLGHHPEGNALASLGEVMSLQSDLLSYYGVPINIAEGVMARRISEVSRSVASANHQRSVDAARLLDIPFMVAHTVADNMVYKFLENLMIQKKPKTVGDVLEILKEVPEYQQATKQGAGPLIFCGSENRRVGKIATSGITGGTSGAKEIYEKMAQSGIGTIIDMHMSEDHKKEAEKHHINVVVAGHIASDSLGFNLLLDEIEKKGVEIIPTSGLIRIKR